MSADSAQRRGLGASPPEDWAVVKPSGREGPAAARLRRSQDLGASGTDADNGERASRPEWLLAGSAADRGDREAEPGGAGDGAV